MDGKDCLKAVTLTFPPHLGFLPLVSLACIAGLPFLAESGVAGTQMAQVELSIFKLISASAGIGSCSINPKPALNRSHIHSHTKLTSYFLEV